MTRTMFERAMDRRRNLRAEEAAGNIADSLEYRMFLMEKVRNREISLEEAQRQLRGTQERETQKTAEKQGKLTRDKAYRNG